MRAMCGSVEGVQRAAVTNAVDRNGIPTLSPLPTARICLETEFCMSDLKSEGRDRREQKTKPLSPRTWSPEMGQQPRGKV
jgi:hypothetical protein